MFAIDIDVSEVERAWNEAALPGLNAGIASAVREACKEGAREAVNGHIYEDRTTQLTASIHGDGEFVITADGAEGSLIAGEDYASYVDQWERTKSDMSFMDKAAVRAEQVLTEGIDSAAEEAERRFNSR